MNKGQKPGSSHGSWQSAGTKALCGKLKADSLADELEIAVLAGGPQAQAGKRFKAVTTDTGGAHPQAGERLEAVVLDEGLQAVGEVAGGAVRAQAPCAGAPGERGLQAVLAGSGRARAPAAAAAARAGGTLQAVTLDAGRVEAGEGLEAVGREGAGAAAEAGRRARAVGRGRGARLGVVAGGGRIRIRGRHSAHERSSVRPLQPDPESSPGPLPAPRPLGSVSATQARGRFPRPARPRPARPGLAWPGPHALRSGGTAAAAGDGRRYQARGEDRWGMRGGP